MADGITENNPWGELKRRAHRLALAADSLANLFGQEAARLNREAEVASLKSLHHSVLLGLQRARDMEDAASMGHNIADGAISVARLVAGLITGASENEGWQAISRQLLAEPDDRRTPFGTVMVRVGPGGLPADVAIVIISSMARDLEASERRVTEILVAQGNLLFSAEAFSRLIDALADRILKGELSLPVSPQKLRQLGLPLTFASSLPAPTLPPVALPPLGQVLYSSCGQLLKQASS